MARFTQMQHFQLKYWLLQVAEARLIRSREYSLEPVELELEACFTLLLVSYKEVTQLLLVQEEPETPMAPTPLFMH
jgi:hypothetical protein